MHAPGQADPASLVADIRPAPRIQPFDAGHRGRGAVLGPEPALPEAAHVRPLSDPVLPWTALLLGLWIPNFFYWGLNQYITQRTLGSKSLAQGQKGIVFAAFLKLLIPFVVVIPGILAFNLFSKDMQAQAESEE